MDYDIHYTSINKINEITIPKALIDTMNLYGYVGMYTTSNSIIISDISDENKAFIGENCTITIPNNILNELNINPQTVLEIFIEDEYLVVEISS